MTTREKMARAAYAADWPEPHHKDWDESDADMQARYFTMVDTVLGAMREPDCAFGLYVVAGDALRGQSLAASQERAFAVEKAWHAMVDVIAKG